MNTSTGSPQAPIADVDVAAVAALIGDRARCLMLHCLLDGSERPAGELARAAGVSATTVSGHLHRLVGAGLLTVRACGRHRYYRLAGPQVAVALEALALIAPPMPVSVSGAIARRVGALGSRLRIPHPWRQGLYEPGMPDARAELPLPVGLADEGLARWVSGVRQAPGPSCRQLGAQALRAGQRRRVVSRPVGPQLPCVQDLATERVPLRLYRPVLQPRPVVLYLHGGGFVIGDLESHDSTCRRLAWTADVSVVAVDFRRAPEHPGPAAVQDTVAAYKSVRQHLDELGGAPASGVALAGDSSGGAIAVLAAVELREAGQRPSALLLAYPNADLTLTQPSVEEKGHGWGLEAEDLRWFVEQWAPDPAQRSSSLLSPAHADLSGLPPTVLATAEHDPLRDEGSGLARELGVQGVDVDHRHYGGLVHGFLGLGHLSPAADRASTHLFRQLGSLVHDPSR